MLQRSLKKIADNGVVPAGIGATVVDKVSTLMNQRQTALFCLAFYFLQWFWRCSKALQPNQVADTQCKVALHRASTRLKTLGGLLLKWQTPWTPPLRIFWAPGRLHGQQIPRPGVPRKLPKRTSGVRGMWLPCGGARRVLICAPHCRS
jgi:hypothetical protein